MLDYDLSPETQVFIKDYLIKNPTFVNKVKKIKKQNTKVCIHCTDKFRNRNKSYCCSHCEIAHTNIKMKQKYDKNKNKDL